MSNLSKAHQSTGLPLQGSMTDADATAETVPTRTWDQLFSLVFFCTAKGEVFAKTLLCVEAGGSLSLALPLPFPFASAGVASSPTACLCAPPTCCGCHFVSPFPSLCSLHLSPSLSLPDVGSILSFRAEGPQGRLW